MGRRVPHCGQEGPLLAREEPPAAGTLVMGLQTSRAVLGAWPRSLSDSAARWFCGPELTHWDFSPISPCLS